MGALTLSLVYLALAFITLNLFFWFKVVYPSYSTAKYLARSYPELYTPTEYLTKSGLIGSSLAALAAPLYIFYRLIEKDAGDIVQITINRKGSTPEEGGHVEKLTLPRVAYDYMNFWVTLKSKD